MATKILIAGGTGFIGRHLTTLLLRNGFDVRHLSRSPAKGEIPTHQWDPARGLFDPSSLEVDYLINLTGAGIADSRWTAQRKETLLQSRIQPIDLLFEEVKKHAPSLKGFISFSAIGYYGLDRGDAWMEEESTGTSEFISDLVHQWETHALQFESLQVPTTLFRVGIVLENGGALARIGGPIKWGIGAALGSGKQYMSWIHMDDLCEMVRFAIDKNLSGTFNAVAPDPVTNTALTKTIARVIRRPLILPRVPAFALRVLFGELADVLLGSLRIRAEKIRNTGFQFSYDELEPAIRHIYGK